MFKISMNFPLRLVLASKSPRRKEILRFAGIPFRVFEPRGVVEQPKPRESSSKMTVRLALEKARFVANQIPQSLVLGADTVVECRGKIFGKPRSRVQAREMLQCLEGRSHSVWTGIALIGENADITRCHVEKTEVFFRRLGSKERENYLDTAEPYDKAGAYAIQGTAHRWVEKWEGDYFNVMGLPLRWVVEVTKPLLNRSGTS